jgi:predicted transposase/invertase (TIGR01784 family)
VNIEVQLINKYNIAQRSLYYWARQYSRSIRAGQDYRALPKVIVVGILGFRYGRMGGYHGRYHLREDGEGGGVLTDDLELHLFDLKRFREEREIDVEGNGEHRWLKYLDRETPEEEVKELIKMDEGIARAQERMEAISRDAGLLRAYELYEISLSDETTMLNGAREEGEEIGLARGRSEGLLKGRAEGEAKLGEEKARIAGGLKAMGMPAEQIAAVTGLDPADIAAL